MIFATENPLCGSQTMQQQCLCHQEPAADEHVDKQIQAQMRQLQDLQKVQFRLISPKDVLKESSS